MSVIELPFNRAMVPGVIHPTSKLLIGDARERLRDLPEASVQCVVTSPPYFGLRDYGVAGQIGLEDRVADYVAALVDVFSEVRRVLRPDGVVWLNLGDSYAGGNSGQRVEGINQRMLDRPGHVATQGTADRVRIRRPGVDGFRSKDLIGVPWRVAFALQDDGWYLRSDIVWSKPNPVPESVRDRPTRSHEYVFLLTLEPRYHYDREAITEPAESSPSDQRKIAEGRQRSNTKGYRMQDPTTVNAAGGQLARAAAVGDGLTRNRRTVWSIATQPFKGAHFAVFPPDLAEPCVLAGTSPFACSLCGTPYKRMVRYRKAHASHSAQAGRSVDDITSTGKHAGGDREVNGSRGTLRAGPVVESVTTGWRQGCVCGAPTHLKMRPDDMELIESPAGEGGTEDPTLEVGRRGLARERGEDAGTTVMTRYEQRQYAAQLREIRKLDATLYSAMCEQAGVEAMAHYARADRIGARAIPADLLIEWFESNWLKRVHVPVWDSPPLTECVVLDPFAGSGTVGVVCGWHGRTFIGVELNPDNARLARDRIVSEGRPGRRPAAPAVVSDDQLNLLA